MILPLILAAHLAAPQPSPSPTPPPPYVILNPGEPDQLDIAFVVNDGDHYKMVNYGEFQKILPKCLAIRVQFFNEPEKDGTQLVIAHCILK